jgi:hypothetical protein
MTFEPPCDKIFILSQGASFFDNVKKKYGKKSAQNLRAAKKSLCSPRIFARYSLIR